MPKDTFYFSHDYHARNDEKILELRLKFGAEGYGVFWMLVETMAENENGGAKASLMGGLSLGYGVAKDLLLAIINFCLEIELFYEESGCIFSRRMKKHKDYRQELSKNGKNGAKKRWENGGANRGAIAPLMQRKGKERKEKILKAVFETMPTKEMFNGLPDLKNGSVIQLIKISSGIDATKEDVNGLWEIFKVQNLTGNRYYANEDAVYSHFINWSKTQKKVNISKGSSNEKKMVI
jgi:hypothetical protein